MKKWIALVQLWVVGVLLLAWGSQAADPATPLSFPETASGRRAAAWFQAYDQGEDAMRAFVGEHVAPAALARRPVDARLEVYRRMREEHGTLTPLRVADGGEAVTTVVARTQFGPAIQIQFDCDPNPPHGLLGLLITDGDSEEIEGQGPPPGEAPAAALPEPEAAAALTAYLDSLSRADAFSGAVLIQRDGKPLVRNAYGLADREARRANRADTKFNLGSINKTFTEVAIWRLEAEGKLRLTDTIDRFLLDYPKEKGSKITVAMLLDHRGGTGDIFRPEFDARRLELEDGASWYAYVRDLPLEFDPGSRHAYSNAGFVLLGAIVERVSGLDYYAYVREKIFRPAGMRDTDSYALDAKVANRAIGYTRDRDGERGSRRSAGPGAVWNPNRGFLPARGSAAGGGYSTVDDLARFVAAVRDGKLLGPERSGQLVGPQGGLGIAGGSPGVNAALEAAGPYTIAILANVDPPIAERIALRARRLFAGSPEVRVRRERAESGGPLQIPQRSHVPPAGVEVPMTLATHLPAIDVMVNGQGPFRFAIDTGGSGAARLDSAFAARMGMKSVGEVWGGDPSGRNLKRMDVVALDSISIGGATFATLNASTRSYNEPGRMRGVDGILGFGIFDGYTVTFDYPGGTLRIEPKELPPVDGRDVLAYTDEDGIPSIAIQVDSLELTAHVDAGSMGGFILPERVLAKLPLSKPAEVIGRARTVSNTFEIKGAPLRGTLRIGGIEFVDPRLEFQPIMPDANVGSRVLRDFRLSFDTKNKRIRFARAS